MHRTGPLTFQSAVVATAILSSASAPANGNLRGLNQYDPNALEKIETASIESPKQLSAEVCLCLGDTLFKLAKDRASSDPGTSRKIEQFAERFYGLAEWTTRLNEAPSASNHEFIRLARDEHINFLSDPNNSSFVRELLSELPNAAPLRALAATRTQIAELKQFVGRNSQFAMELREQGEQTQNAFDLPPNQREVRGAFIESRNSAARSSLGVTGASILIGPDGTKADFEALLNLGKKHGLRTDELYDSYSIPESTPAVLAAKQARICTHIDSQGRVQCPFGFRPSSVEDNSGQQHQVIHCVSGAVRIPSLANRTVNIIFEEQAYPVLTQEAQALLKKLVPSQTISLPKYLGGLAASLASDIPDQTKLHLLVQALNDKMIYSLDSRLGRKLAYLGEDALQWATEFGGGWCASKSTMIANLFNSVGLPAWVIEGSAPDSRGYYIEQPGHAMVAVMLNGKILTYDPTIGAKKVDYLPWHKFREADYSIIEHAQNLRKETLSESQYHGASDRQESGHSCRDSCRAARTASSEVIKDHLDTIEAAEAALKTESLVDYAKAIARVSWNSRPSYQAAFELREQQIAVKSPFNLFETGFNLLDSKAPRGLTNEELKAGILLTLGAAVKAPEALSHRDLGFLDRVSEVPVAAMVNLSWRDRSLDLIYHVFDMLAEAQGSLEDHKNLRQMGIRVIRGVLERHSEFSSEQWAALGNKIAYCLYSAMHHHFAARWSIENPGSSIGSSGRLTKAEKALLRDSQLAIAEYHELQKGFAGLIEEFPNLGYNPGQLALYLVKFTHEQFSLDMATFFGRAAKGTIFENIFDTQGNFAPEAKREIDETVREYLVSRERLSSLGYFINSSRYVPPTEKIIEHAKEFLSLAEAQAETLMPVYTEKVLGILQGVCRGIFSDDYPFCRQVYAVDSVYIEEVVELFKAWPEAEAIFKNSAILQQFLQQHEQYHLEQKAFRDPDSSERFAAGSSLGNVHFGLFQSAFAKNSDALTDPRGFVLNQTLQAFPDLYLNEDQSRQRSIRHWQRISKLYPEAAQALEQRILSPELQPFHAGFISDNCKIRNHEADKLAYLVETHASFAKFRKDFGNVLSEMKQTLIEQASTNGCVPVIASIAKSTATVGYKPEQIFMALLIAEKATPPIETYAHKVINISGLVEATLQGRLKVPDLKKSKRLNQGEPDKNIRRHPSGQTSGSEFDYREVRSGEALSGRYDPAMSARFDSTFVRVEQPVTGLTKKPGQLTVILHPDWLVEAKDRNWIEEPIRLLSLIKGLDEARSKGQTPRLLYWDGLNYERFELRDRNQMLSCAQKLYAYMDRYHTDSARNGAPVGLRIGFGAPEDRFVVREREEFIYLCGSSGSASDLAQADWAKYLKVNPKRLIATT